jgi:hypothetical protein
MCSKALEEWGIIVDNFHTKNRPPTAHYFLTHLHSDHTGGLSPTWDKAPLYVSEGTLIMMRLRYGHSSVVVNHTNALVYYSWTNLYINNKWIEVACIPANHCVGSVIWIFVLPNKSSVVHTGDYRPDEHMFRWSGWNRIKPVSLLLYDSSFNDPRIKIPTLNQGISALQSVFSRLNKRQRLAVFVHTSGVERLIGEWCNNQNLKWHVDDSAKNRLETELGLSEIAPFKRANTIQQQQNSTIWCVGESFRTKHTNDRWIYVRPSAVWFMCHRNQLEDQEYYKFGTAVPDETNTFRVFYSTHASYEENQTFIKFLRPQMSTGCVKTIIPSDCGAHSVNPNWEYHTSVKKPLLTFKSKRLPDESLLHNNPA